MGSEDATADGDDVDADAYERGEREQGVDLGALAEELEAHDYPTTNETLIEEYGAHELVLAEGSESLREVLGELPTDESYDSADAVRQMIFNMVGADAVGREGYSDRGGIAGDRNDIDASNDDVEDESI